MSKTGIIYYAYNKVSGKYYVGQTVQPFKMRIRNHYSVAKHDRSTNVHFKNALKFYNIDEWDWKVIEEVEVDKLNEREHYWIRKYDSFENGYNCNWGGGQPVIAAKKHKLYHPDYGVVEEDKYYFTEYHNFKYATLSQLIHKRVKSAFGWVLAEYKDNYNEYIKRNYLVHSIYSPKTGVITGTNKEIKEKVNIHYLYHLTSKRCKILDGFVLAENKEDYYNILNE